MTKKVKKDLKLRAGFETLKDDISQLSEELYFLKNRIEEPEKRKKKHKKNLRFLKVCIYFVFIHMKREILFEGKKR